jgi:hypothetical protein
MADGRGCWTSTPPPRTRPHLNGAGPGVEVAVMAVRGYGGGATAEPPRPPLPRVSWLSCRYRQRRGCRKWSSLAIGGGGAAHQGEALLT